MQAIDWSMVWIKEIADQLIAITRDTHENPEIKTTKERKLQWCTFASTKAAQNLAWALW